MDSRVGRELNINSPVNGWLNTGGSSTVKPYPTLKKFVGAGAGSDFATVQNCELVNYINEAPESMLAIYLNLIVQAGLR